RIRQEPHGLHPPDRHEPGDPASTGQELDGARSRLADGAARRLAIRPEHALRARRQLRKVSGSRSRLPRLRAGGDDPWRLRLCQGISRRALLAGIPDPPHRTHLAAAHSQLHRRESARPAEVILRFVEMSVHSPSLSFRGAPKARAMGRNCAPENPYSRSWLWIPGPRYARPG